MGSFESDPFKVGQEHPLKANPVFEQYIEHTRAEVDLASLLNRHAEEERLAHARLRGARTALNEIVATNPDALAEVEAEGYIVRYDSPVS